MRYEIEFSTLSDADLRALRRFDQRRIIDAIEAQLVVSPSVFTRNRKCLGDNVTSNFEYVPPLWELRVGDHRVFYEIAEERKTVFILAVRLKPPGKTTDEVLNENDSG